MSGKLRYETVYTAGRSNRFCNGFTLTEVAVASAILAFAMVPVLKGMAGAHAASVSIERKTRSLSLARSKIEEIKARSIYSYDSGFAESDTSVDDSYLCDVYDSAQNSNLRRITVAVGYDEDQDRLLDADEVKVILETLIARRWSHQYP